MKALIAFLILATSSSFLRAATTGDKVPLTTEDLLTILEVDASKYKVDFDSPKRVVMRFESEGQKHDFPLDHETPKSVVLLTRIKDEGSLKQLSFWFGGAQSNLSATVAFTQPKIMATRSDMVDGVFTILAYDPAQPNGPFAYRIQIIASEK